jgi:hypothetical protein
MQPGYRSLYRRSRPLPRCYRQIVADQQRAKSRREGLE